MAMRRYLRAACICAGLAAFAFRAEAAESKECEPPILKVGKVTAIHQGQPAASAGLGDRLRIEIKCLLDKVKNDSFDPSTLRLVLDGFLIKGARAALYDVNANLVEFRLSRATEDLSSWTSLLGAPPSEGTRKITVGVGPENGLELPFSDMAKPTIDLRIFDVGWVWGAAVFVFILIIALLYFGQHSDMLRDSNPAGDLSAGKRRPYSLARCQMAFWLVLITGAFLFVWIVTREFNGVVTAEALALLGISATTALSSVALDASKKLPPGKSWPPSENFLKDILTDVNGVTLARFQMFTWTLVLGVIFVVGAYRSLALPRFDAALLALLGISGGIYVGFKWPEKQFEPATRAPFDK